MSCAKKYDVRLIDRHIEQGILTKEEYNQYLDALPDAADKAVEIDEIQPIVDSLDEDLVDD